MHGVLCAYFDFVDRADQDGAFRLVFESDLVNDPAVRSRVEGVSQKTMEAVAITVASDTGSTRQAPICSPQRSPAPPKWRPDGGSAGRPVGREGAIDLMEALMWRGISNFPEQDYVRSLTAQGLRRREPDHSTSVGATTDE